MNNDVQMVGWSFADLKDPKKERKIMEPITVLVYAALFPCFEEGTKIGLSGRTVTVQEPSDYNYSLFGMVKIPTRWAFRSVYKEDNNNLEVFKLCAINAAEYYNPVNDPEIRKLFECARDGIVATKKAYANGKSSPCDAIDKYQETMQKAISGVFRFDTKLSDAEERVKSIWSQKEIIWLNNTISMILENKKVDKPVDTDLESIQRKLKEKEDAFRTICDEVIANRLNIQKHPKPHTAAKELKQPAPPEQDEGLVEGVNAEEMEASVLVEEYSPEPKAAASKKKEQGTEEEIAAVVEGEASKPKAQGNSRKKK